MEGISDITCIDTSTIRSAIQNIRSTINEGNSAVEQIEGSLGDDVWQAGAKNTLKKGYEKLKSFPKENIESILTTMETVCGKIDELKQIVREIDNLNRIQNPTEEDETELASKIVTRNALASKIRGMCN